MTLLCIHADGQDVLHVWYKPKPQPSRSSVATSITAAFKQQQGSTSTGRSRRTKAATADDVPHGAEDLAKGLGPGCGEQEARDHLHRELACQGAGAGCSMGGEVGPGGFTSICDRLYGA